MPEPWKLASTPMAEIAKHTYEVAVLPLGATEPHNFHLPEGLDVLHATHVAERVCQMAWPRCRSIICLPPLPYGVDCNLSDFPLAIHVSQATLDAMIAEIIESLVGYGIRKVVLVNGHGGNDFTPLVRQIQCDLDAHVFLCNWWTVGMDRYGEIFDKPDDHAGEFETSVALALCPETVMLEEAGDGRPRPFRFEALNKGWVRTSRRFARLNDCCAAGDPTGATAEKGLAYLDLVCGRLADFLVELAATPIDEHFPQTPDKI